MSRELDAVGWPAIPQIDRSELSDFDLEVEQQDQELAQHGSLSPAVQGKIDYSKIRFGVDPDPDTVWFEV